MLLFWNLFKNVKDTRAGDAACWVGCYPSIEKALDFISRNTYTEWGGTHTSISRTWDVEAGGSEAQDHP